MKLLFWTILSALLLVGSCEEKAAENAEEEKPELLLMEVEMEPEHMKPKRQAEQGRAIGATTQHIYGSAPGHYVLRTKDTASEAEAEYLAFLRQIENGGLQPAAAQERPTVQQYLIPRPQAAYASQVAEPKIIQVQPTQAKRPVFTQNQLTYQPNIQGARTPLVLRPSQAVRPTPVQGIYTSQGFYPNSPAHSLHEARVQAALSVADDKQATIQNAAQSIYQYNTKPQSFSSSDSTFEKELAQLVAANQEAELKAKPAPQPIQYFQTTPQKQTYTLVPSPKLKSYQAVRPDAQLPKYVAPSVQRTKTAKFPQQYLIETTKPQPPVARPVAPKPKPQPQYQYIQVPNEEPKFYEYQSFPQDISPMKIVSAPQLNTQSPLQFKQYSTKETNEPASPAYLQYYQTVKPESEEITSSNDIKLSTYVPRFIVPKTPSSTPSPSEEQPAYIPKYQTVPKTENPRNYVRYKAAKPQLTAQYSAEDDSLIQTLLSQSLQKSQQGLSGFSSPKTANTETKPQIAPQVGESHSSIFVSKALIPKKKNNPVVQPEPIEEADNEDIQTVRLPPPKNNKVYTQDEFQALLAAGYSVTPVPVADDDDTSPVFSPAPENYPGHNKYQPSVSIGAVPEQPQIYHKQSSETYATATSAPRTRKVQRRRPVSTQRYRTQSENFQSESESQPQLTYTFPLQAEETSSYGLKKQTKFRSRLQQQEPAEEASDS